ncbi:hypothetical protein XM38_002850 [Halomicronema hongdechloris C2206]|uniref:Uncharacterized protein n=1 Tax=Halomicronema hongdechloris C2206 TaxID=1641165 RepID=A0A1Z3HGI3_9CYAN|nr:hypothetical protein [Halomicronema hongdechloris]ASC69358.1 hypothetical protein XM38_002850 [Halomicronema hongdechloris C2206]
MAFRPNQILYLEHNGRRLYVEVIQIIESRQICWARPLLLVDVSDSQEMPDDISPEHGLHCLQGGPDILWPLAQFQPALDTALLPLLGYLTPSGAFPTSASFSERRLHQPLRQFMDALWMDQQQQFFGQGA